MRMRFGSHQNIVGKKKKKKRKKEKRFSLYASLPRIDKNERDHFYKYLSLSISLLKHFFLLFHLLLARARSDFAAEKVEVRK